MTSRGGYSYFGVGVFVRDLIHHVGYFAVKFRSIFLFRYIESVPITGISFVSRFGEILDSKFEQVAHASAYPLETTICCPPLNCLDWPIRWIIAVSRENNFSVILVVNTQLLRALHIVYPLSVNPCDIIVLLSYASKTHFKAVSRRFNDFE